MNWIEVEENEIPKDGKEYLTRNELQGGVLQLISWDKLHKCYKNKGDVRIGKNVGSQWFKIPKYIAI